MTTHQHRVLVVEDDDDSRDALVTLLQIEGFEAFGASSGSEALAHLDAARPCVILLDGLLHDGRDADRFREQQLAHPVYATIPVVLVSGAGELSERARELRAHASVQKPIDFAQLIAIVGVYCSA